MDELHIGDIGTSLRLTVQTPAGVAIDVSDPESLIILLEKPNGGSVLQRTASLLTDGADGVIHYETVSGDLDEAGVWRIQGFVELAEGEWYTSTTKFRVLSNLANVG